MSEQTTFTKSDRTDGVEPDMVDQNHAPKSEAPTAAAVMPSVAVKGMYFSRPLMRRMNSTLLGSHGAVSRTDWR